MRSDPVPFYLGPVVLLSFLSASCVPDSQSAVEWDGTVHDSAGIEIVVNGDTPLWKPGEEWQLVEDMRIGRRDGPPEYQFGRITGFTELSDGRIVVADGMVPEIRFYSPEGEHLRSMGKEGNGPRELGKGWIIVIRGPADTLLIVDPRNIQVHRVTPEGEWAASFSTRPEDGWRVSNWDYNPSGMVVSFLEPLIRPNQPPADTMAMVVVRKLDGTLGDTVGRMPMSRNFRFVGDVREFHYYAGIAAASLMPSGRLVTGRSDKYELIWRRSDGSPERIVRLAREARPFTEAEQSVLMSRFDEMLANRPPARRQQIKNSIRFEDVYPFYRRFMNGPNETIWLRRIRPIADMGPEEVEELDNNQRPKPGPGFDVFDARGRYLGIVEAPLELPFGLFLGDRLFGIMKDELDVEYLQIWRIEGMAGSAAADS